MSTSSAESVASGAVTFLVSNSVPEKQSNFPSDDGIQQLLQFMRHNAAIQAADNKKLKALICVKIYESSAKFEESLEKFQEEAHTQYVECINRSS